MQTSVQHRPKTRLKTRKAIDSLNAKVNERLTAGIGGIYRVVISDKHEYFVHGLHVFGGRTYVGWTFKKGFFVHGEFEALKVNAHPVTALYTTANEALEDHSYNAYAGIGRRFNISRKIKGSVLGIYRFELDGYVPGFNKVNVRLGFHYNLAKKKRSRG